MASLWELVFSMAFATNYAIAVVRYTSPLLLTAVGECFAERSGVLDLGIEGIISMGALSSFATFFFTSNPFLSVVVGMVTGALFGLVHALFTVSFRTDQIVTGIGIWILCWGLSGYIYRQYFVPEVGSARPTVHGMGVLPIPLLSDIPLIGPALFNQPILGYISYILVPIAALILFKTSFGLRITSCGENPAVADALGVNVYRTRYICVIIGGILAALGGAFLSIAQLNIFVEEMSAGRGWVAVAIVMLGKWNPKRILGAALLFGAVEALQLRINSIFSELYGGTLTGMSYGLYLPWQFLAMWPYLLAVIVLIIVARRAELPAALCTSFKRGEK